MASTALRRDSTPRVAWGQAAAAFVAAGGAAAVQSGWQPGRYGWDLPAWPPYLAGVLIAVTAWLLQTAWRQGRAALRAGDLAPPARGELFRRLGLDAIVVAAALAILLRGARSPVLLAGLWLVPPVLLAAGVASLIATLAAARAGRSDFTAEATPDRRGKDWLQAALTLALLASLTLLDRQTLPSPDWRTNPVASPPAADR